MAPIDRSVNVPKSAHVRQGAHIQDVLGHPVGGSSRNGAWHELEVRNLERRQPTFSHGMWNTW